MTVLFCYLKYIFNVRLHFQCEISVRLIELNSTKFCDSVLNFDLFLLSNNIIIVRCLGYWHYNPVIGSGG